MAYVTGIGFFVHHMTDRGSVRGIDCYPFLVQDSDLIHELLHTDSNYHFFYMRPVVQQHLVPCAADDRFSQLIGGSISSSITSL